MLKLKKINNYILYYYNNKKEELNIMPEMRQMIINTDKSKPYDDGRLKRQLICIKSKYSEDSWDFIEGREDAYEYIKDRIDDIDFETSFIVVSSQKIDDRKSIYAFMNYAKKFFPDDTFDIDDYVKGDWNEDDFRASNNMDPLFTNIGDEEKLDMISVLNGNTVVTELGGDE